MLLKVHLHSNMKSMEKQDDFLIFSFVGQSLCHTWFDMHINAVKMEFGQNKNDLWRTVSQRTPRAREFTNISGDCFINFNRRNYNGS